MSVELVACRTCHAEITIYCVDETGQCNTCRWDEQLIEERTHTICSDCGGSGLSPYPDDGGSCPHCFGGYKTR